MRAIIQAVSKQAKKEKKAKITPTLNNFNNFQKEDGTPSGN